jgi:hypothetical protein
MTIDAISNLDLSHNPPLGSPWDAIQIATENWVREYQLSTEQRALSA